MTGGFTLLWAKILHSSIWVKESKETRLVWITLLAKKDRFGKVQASVLGLADLAKVTPKECKDALKVLLSPDDDDTSKVEEGRRIREIPGGWEIVNHDQYRFSTEEKREFWRTQKAEQRAKKENDTEVEKSIENMNKAMPRKRSKPKSKDQLADEQEAWAAKKDAEAQEHARLADEWRNSTT